MPTIYRDYQKLSIELIRKHWLYKPIKLLLHMAPGAGKTVIFSYILKNCSIPCAMIVRGRKLVDQASARLIREGVPHGVIMAGHWNNQPNERIQICSVDTLGSRIEKEETIKFLKKCKIIVFDEVHFATSQFYFDILELLDPECRILGVTGSPFNPKGLGHIADKVIKPITMLELIKRGYLVPGRIFCPDLPDLTGIAINGGDFNKGQLAAKMDEMELVGNLVDTWKKYGENRSSLYFAVNVKHSKHIAQEFRNAGISAVHCDANTPDAEREEVLEAHRKGGIKIITNVNIFSVGVDIPWLQLIGMARPTRSLNLYIQQAGRPTRPDPENGKTNFILLDHAGNVVRHGVPTFERDALLKPQKKRSKEEEEKYLRSIAPIICSCLHAYPAHLKECPECGKLKPDKTEILDPKSGQLKEIQSIPPEVEYLGRLKQIQKSSVRKSDGKKYSNSWLWHKMKNKFGEAVANKYVKKRKIPDWLQAENALKKKLTKYFK